MLGEDEPPFSGDIVLLIILCGVLDIAREKNAATIAVELEFLNAVGERVKVAEQTVLLFPGSVQKTKRAARQQNVSRSAKRGENRQAEQNLPGQPAEINRAPEQQRHIEGEDWQTLERLGHTVNVIGQCHDEPGRAYFFE